MKEQKNPDEYTDFDEYIKQGRLISEAVRDLQNGYPGFEKDCLSYSLKAIEASDNVIEALIKDFETECNVLLKCIAVSLFGYSEKPDFELDILENESIKKMIQFIGIDELARSYENKLDRGIAQDARLRKHEETDTEIQTPLVGSNSELYGMEGAWEGMKYWARKDVNYIITSGLEGHLIPSIKLTVRRNLLDAMSKEDPQFDKLWRKAKAIYKPKSQEEKYKLLERVKNILFTWGKELTEPEDKEISGRLKFEFIGARKALSLDRVFLAQDEKLRTEMFTELKEPVNEIPAINREELTAKQLEVLEDVRAANELGLSLPEYWGTDYGRKIKMLQRLKAKLKKS